MKLKNKISLVIGAGDGIGKYIALEYSRQGSTVIVSDHNEKNGKETSQKIKSLGGKSQFIKCDVRKMSEIEGLISKVLRKYKEIDILVNSARVFVSESISKVTKKECDDIIDTNLKGMFHCISKVSKSMVQKNKGKIISIASIAGEVGLNNSSVYSAANGGIINLTKELAIELAPHKINVNCISPGIIATELFDDLLSDKENREEFLSNIPLGRFGTPEEVANAAVFLASKDANFITGHNLVVDGAWLSH